MKYLVKIREVHTVSIEVDAADADEALVEAHQILEEGESEKHPLLKSEYEYTLDQEDWSVEEVK